MGEGPTLATRPFQAAAMQLTVPDLLDADAVRSATAALRAVDPAATVAADVSRRQLHAGGRLDASAAIAALQHPETADGTFYIDDGNAYTAEDLARIAGHAVGTQPLVLHFPMAPLQVFANVVELGARITGRPAFLTRDKVADMSQQFWTGCINAAREALEWEPNHTFESSAHALVEWFEAHDQL